MEKRGVLLAGLLLHQLNIPVQIISPGVRDFPVSNGYLQGWEPGRTYGFADQLHPRFLGGTASLFPIALDTAGHNVGPFSLSPSGSGYDVIIVKFFRREFSPAILAPVFIPCVDVLS